MRYWWRDEHGDGGEALFNREGEASAKYYGRLFRDALDVLAVEYGLAGRGNARPG